MRQKKSLTESTFTTRLCWHALLQVSVRIISDGRLLAKSLTADVERITREKQVTQERAETTKVHTKDWLFRKCISSTACHVAQQTRQVT